MAREKKVHKTAKDGILCRATAPDEELLTSVRWAGVTCERCAHKREILESIK